MALQKKIPDHKDNSDTLPDIGLSFYIWLSLKIDKAACLLMWLNGISLLLSSYNKKRVTNISAPYQWVNWSDSGALPF